MTKTIAFFNNKGGVGKTTLVYHLAWMFADLGHRIVAADLDPQANLTAMFLDDERLEALWEPDEQAKTIRAAVAPLRGVGDVKPVELVMLSEQLALLPGDVGLSAFEDMLADHWGKCYQEDPRGYIVTTSLTRVLADAGRRHDADLVIVDVGPNLGAINRSVLLGADFIVIPVAADLFSIVGLKNLGPTLRQWRSGWEQLRKKRPADLELTLPEGMLRPLGYVTVQDAVLAESRPTKAYRRWMHRIPEAYRRYVLDSTELEASPSSVEVDPECLAVLKHYRSLMPMAQTARKPIFRLTSADGALGSHAYAVKDAYRDFETLSWTIGERSGAFERGDTVVS
ncbi:MAG: ParA family protein [Myxococcales bacterium]|nr:ParA family protein [Myxococcales bacterium]